MPMFIDYEDETPEEIERITNKLNEWINSPLSIIPPDGFGYSWTVYPSTKCKKIVKQLVLKKLLSNNFNQRKIDDFGHSVTATELTEGIRQQTKK